MGAFDKFLLVGLISYFVQVNHAKEMLSGLHYFEKAFEVCGKNGKERKAAFHWHKADKKGLAKSFIQLCHALFPVFEAEQRCLRLDAPWRTPPPEPNSRPGSEHRVVRNTSEPVKHRLEV